MDTKTPASRSQSPFRRRGPRIGVSAAIVVSAAIGADAAFGAVAQRKASCRVVDGATIHSDLRVLPVTSGLLTGSVGTASVHVPWDVAAQRLAATSPDGANVSLSAADGLVIIESSARSLPVQVAMLAEVTRSGELAFSPVAVSIAGREVPLGLASTLGGAGELLQQRTLSADAATGLGYRISAAKVTQDGMNLNLSLPRQALTEPGEGESCGPSDSGSAVGPLPHG